ncbi:MAG: universal stress protein [Methanoregula sp.]|jgi:nucleotide-binding universal stress UspA family protein|uniref:universal stress protein n=1 Tax=Methanoregula sp. TaxID=2052170 RepID=UPI003C28690F
MTNRLFEKILIATDGSDRNRAAVEEALQIGRVCGSAVFAAYVIDLSAFESASADVVIRDTWVVIQREAEASLARVRARAGGVNLETVTLEGKPAAEIVRFAAENGIDLIVIGTQGKRGFERLLLGSVAEQVVRLAPCKVLVVK